MEKQDNKSRRPIMVFIDLVGKKWLLRILWELNDGPCTFRELQSRCGQISPTMINKRVKELTKANLIEKVKPKGYRLTGLGAELMELFDPFDNWLKTWEKTLS